MKVTLKEQFTEDQKKLAQWLYDELLEGSEQLSEFSTVEVYGLKEDEDGTSILFEINYSCPEQNGKHTIYGNY
jgi:hypothetical protein